MELHTKVTNALALGLVKRGLAHEAEEATKVGTLRGGTSGCIADGRFYGKCPRVAYLRYKGVQEPADQASQELFEAGYASEPALLNRLELGLEGGHTLAPAGSLDFQWKTPSGVTVSGRPDGGVLDPDGKLVYGLELKLAASMWTTFAVSYDKRPRSDHLIQAAHYSLQLGRVPFALVYSVRNEIHLSTAPKWLQEKFTKDTPFVECKDGKPFKIRPHTTVYTCFWDAGGRWCYVTEGMDQPQPTVIDADGIVSYYEAVAALDHSPDLPARPTDKAVDGSKSFLPCAYCDFADLCDSHEHKGTRAWMDHVLTAYSKEDLKA